MQKMSFIFWWGLSSNLSSKVLDFSCNFLKIPIFNLETATLRPATQLVQLHPNMQHKWLNGQRSQSLCKISVCQSLHTSYHSRLFFSQANKTLKCSLHSNRVASREISFITCSTGFNSVLLSAGRLLGRQLLFCGLWQFSHQKKRLCACLPDGLAHSLPALAIPKWTDRPHTQDQPESGKGLLSWIITTTTKQ